MSDITCFADICGFCCICCSASLTSYCATKSFGRNGRGCGGQAGCCGACCNDAFNDDAFDEQVKKDLARTRADPDARPQPVGRQPRPAGTMEVGGMSASGVTEVPLVRGGT